MSSEESLAMNRSHDESLAHDRTHRYSDPQDSRPPRKQLEQLRVSSGLVLIIDQFMLANQQFLGALPEDAGSFEEEEDRIRAAARRYGGSVLRLTPGRWGVLREPRQTFMLIAPVGDGELSQYESSFDVDTVAEARGNLVPIDKVFVDTRCVVFLDIEVLGEKSVLKSYREYRLNGDDKSARDLLREHGCAVRYGFRREGDELGVYRLGGDGHIALWPVEKAPEKPSSDSTQNDTTDQLPE